jgi:CubicO group peptidase (beta-lactamase class C family)
MKTANLSIPAKAVKPFGGLKHAFRVVLKAFGWLTLMLGTLLTGYFSGWILLPLIRLNHVPQSIVFIAMAVILVPTIAASFLVAKFTGSWRRVVILAGGTLVMAFIAWLSWNLIYPDRGLFLARQVAWGDSTLKDYQLFPKREVANAAAAFHFEKDLSPDLFQKVEFRSGGELKQADFEDFLRSTHTTSFIVIKDDSIRYEGYFNGYSRDSIVTSFSTAKSFTSALVGIAIDEGFIGGVNDPIVKYLPEFKGKGLDELTIRHLLTMSSGIRYLTDDETPPFGEITQFTDDGLTYTYPDMRALALQVKTDGKPLASEFNYNNYHPILLGMILERATGKPVSEYLQEKIWKPLGMEYPASWSLDSEKDGFELMGSGINGRAIDFAKFGRLFLHNGDWDGRQLISKQWVTESTSPDPNDQRLWHSDSEWKAMDGYYKYLWWGRYNPDGSYDYTALGHLGQYVYISPQEKMIIVRFGMDEGGVDSWPDVFQNLIANVTGRFTDPDAARTLSTGTPEEHGFDSAKLAEGLVAIRQSGTPIHSLMIVRDDTLVLDAYFYPYDGSIYHDLASVTKSVMTTLIGIAIDQGKLSLDDPMLSFFPTRQIANQSGRKERITIRHLASMSSGLECDHNDDENTLDRMRSSPDWVQFALDRKAVREPGEQFVYCGLDMHLLSAILQQATGMTALAFANEYLFSPLGIQDIYWPADPQGYTHGWGDLCLRPLDMAKFGSLFLHNGQWAGRQIVSRTWVESALKARMKGTGKIEDYGYGWWIGQPENVAEFLASGNGGQKIKVYPDLDLILVITGGGFEYSEIEPYLVASIGDMSAATLPANPAGIASLEAALETIGRGPQPEAVPSLPPSADEISGRTYVFEDNPLLLSLRLDFDGSAVATFQLEVVYEPGPRVMVVGLDNVYRTSRVGRPILTRGAWTDAQIFVIETNEGPGFATYSFNLHFEGDRLTLEIPGLGRFEAIQESNLG